MLGMGMTLTFGDLRGALAMPNELLAGFVLQCSVMPLSGYFVSKLLNLPSYYAAGVILVCCYPGGTASNIVTYIVLGKNLEYTALTQVLERQNKLCEIDNGDTSLLQCGMKSVDNSVPNLDESPLKTIFSLNFLWASRRQKRSIEVFLRIL